MLLLPIHEHRIYRTLATVLYWSGIIICLCARVPNARTSHTAAQSDHIKPHNFIQHLRDDCQIVWITLARQKCIWRFMRHRYTYTTQTFGIQKGKNKMFILN